MPDTKAGSPEQMMPRLVSAFGRELSRAGINADTASLIVFMNAIEALGMDKKPSVYWAGRACLVRNPSQIPDYDRIFEIFWSGDGRPGLLEVIEEPQTVAIEDESLEPDGGADGETGDDDPVVVRYSAAELLNSRDFSELTVAEKKEAEAVIDKMKIQPPQKLSFRKTIRLEQSKGQEKFLDMRRTAKRAMRTEGIPLQRSFKKPKLKTRPLILLVDISGSMEVYARFMIRFAHLLAKQRKKVEVFTLGTRLTRITPELKVWNADVALKNVSQKVRDWSGGTRLGENFKSFNQLYALRGIARGAVVAVLSDGWDQSDAELLGEQMCRLKRAARKIIWVNPLKATPGYTPLAKGMAAALPWVDDFVEGNSLRSLGYVANLISEKMDGSAAGLAGAAGRV